jgi:hypothetical protein
MPNWAEQVTAIATAVSALGLLSAIGAVVFAARQAREARTGRQAATAVEFIRRWDEDPLVEARRLIAQFQTPHALADAMTRFIAENSANAYVLYRELDYFEQLGALEKHGAVDFEMIRTLLGRRLIDRWELWRPAIDAIGDGQAYPMFGRLVTKMRAAAGQTGLA